MTIESCARRTIGASDNLAVIAGMRAKNHRNHGATASWKIKSWKCRSA